MNPLRLAPLALALLCLPPLWAAPLPSQPVTPGLGSTGTPTLADEHLQRGLAALQANRGDEAKRWLDAALKLRPQHGLTLVALAELASARREPDQALRLLQRAEKAEPANALVLNAFARWHANRNEHAAAIGYFQRAIKADPRLLAPHIDLAEVHARQGDQAQALARLREAEKLDPRSARVQQLIGLTLQRQGDTAAAKRALARAAELDPGDLGTLLLQAQQAESAAEAQPLLDKVLKADAKNIDALVLRAEWQARGGDNDAARQTLRQATQAAPQNAEPWLRLATLAHQAKQTAEARSAYQEALQRAPEHPLVLNNFAVLLVESGGDAVAAEGMARRALQQMPAQAQLHNTLAMALAARKDFKAALQSSQTAVKLDPKDRSLQLQLAEIQLASGDREAAKRTAQNLRGATDVDAGRLAALIKQL